MNTSGLTANTYNGTITIAAPGATSQTVTVTLAVAGNLTASPSSLTFNYTLGGTAPAAQSITVGGTTGLAFTATAATESSRRDVAVSHSLGHRIWHQLRQRFSEYNGSRGEHLHWDHHHRGPRGHIANGHRNSGCLWRDVCSRPIRPR